MTVSYDYAEIQKSWRSYIKSCVIRFAIDIWSTFLITSFFSHNNAFFLSLKKLLLKISDNCQENTSVGTSFWIKIGLNCMPQLIFIKKDTPVKIFPCKCWEKFNVWMNNFALRYSEAAVHRFFFKISFLKNFAIFTEKHMGWNLFLKKLLVWRAATWLKRGSNTGIFLWVLRNF